MKRLLSILITGLATLPIYAIDSVDDICGAYEWTYQSELAYDGGKKIAQVELAPGTTPNTVLVKGLYLDYNLVADVNLKASTLSLRAQSVDFDMDLMKTLKVYLVTRDEEDGTLNAVSKPIVANISDGKIEFNPDEMIGIGYPDIEDGMYYFLASHNVAETAVDRTFVFNPEEWSEPATGHLVDGWLSYHYFGTDTVAEYDVEICHNLNNPNIYCVINPFDNKLWEPFNKDSKAEGHIVFDASNPKFVKLRTYVYSGFSDSEFGMLYMYGTDSDLLYVQGYDEDYLIENVPAVLSTLENGVVDIPQPAFGHEARPTGHYGWGDLKAKIVLPSETAINEVAADNADACPLYFNLQGAAVSNPTTGFYIVIRGSRTEKVLLR